MSTVASAPAPAVVIPTLADLLHGLGDVPPERVLLDPLPGTATVADVIRYVDGDNKRLVELVDGTLVEKAMGYYEGRLGGLVFYFFEDFLKDHDLGLCFCADSTLRFAARVVRLPDVSFVSWSKIPNRELPREQIPFLIPDLAVEILSPGNTRGEMARKRRDFFAAASASSGRSTRIRIPRKSSRPRTSARSSRRTAHWTAATCYRGFACRWPACSSVRESGRGE